MFKVESKLLCSFGKISSANAFQENCTDASNAKKKQVVLEHLAKSVVLDAGCGKGVFSLEAAKNGFRVIAVDLSKKQLKLAKDLFDLEEIDIPVICCSLSNLPFGKETFNSVICCDVIEHVTKISSSFSELHRVLTKGGRVCITTPNGYGPYGIIYDGCFRLPIMAVVSETSRALRRKEIETYHVCRFTPSILMELGKLHNFKVLRYFNTELLATFYHLFLCLLLKRSTELTEKMKRIDTETAQLLPLRLGSEWFLCLSKKE
jgi:2-polyprenyl-3-methyl-5-hydroxy-6-metoxy-1,4-benzoquinol methylase